MNRITIIFLFSVSSMAPWAQTRWNQTYQFYISQYKDLAIREMLQYRIPASTTLIQVVFESGAGRSRLARLGNNHFGIKCHDWIGHTIAGDDNALGECFRTYDHPLQSFEDHSKFFVNNSRYHKLFSLSMQDHHGWAHGLKAYGYVTNSRCAYKLIELIELYKLYVHDSARSYDHVMVEYSGNQIVVNQVKPLYPIAIFNRNYHIRTRHGDTFRLIGEEIGVSHKKIVKYNERDKDDALTEGEIISLRKKGKGTPKAFKNRPHVVKNEENLYITAQIYGVRLANLYKSNDFTSDHTTHVGDVVRVY